MLTACKRLCLAVAGVDRRSQVVTGVGSSDVVVVPVVVVVVFVVFVADVLLVMEWERESCIFYKFLTPLKFRNFIKNQKGNI